MQSGERETICLILIYQNVTFYSRLNIHSCLEKQTETLSLIVFLVFIFKSVTNTKQHVGLIRNF